MKEIKYGIDMTLAEIANEHAKEVLEEKKRQWEEMEMRRKKAHKAWVRTKMFLCLPSAVIAFLNARVFITNAKEILSAFLAIVACLMIASTWTDLDGKE